VNIMHHRYLILTGVFLLCLACTAPVAAITVKHLDITVSENGDADITADYGMNWMEQAVVYPAGVSLLAVKTPEHVAIRSITPDHASLTVQNLASVQRASGSTTYTTPAFSANDAQKVLNQFWFANIVTLDFTPGTLTIRFPDGATTEYADLSSVPSFTHTMLVP
jgi:hypothetical protein